eukprot:749715-Lingulodinium_polyedra.AAC.1
MRSGTSEAACSGMRVGCAKARRRKTAWHARRWGSRSARDRRTRERARRAHCDLDNGLAGHVNGEAKDPHH